MQKASVVVKLWLAFTVLILIVLVPLELALGGLLTNFYTTQVTDPLVYHTQQLAQMLSTGPEALTVAPMMGRMVGGEVLVLDQRGAAVAFPGASRLAAPAEAVEAARRGQPFSGQVTIKEVGIAFVTSAPIRTVAGSVVLVAPAGPMQQSLALARRYLWLAGAGTLLLGTGLALMLARSLLRPVIAIEEATTEIARGNFATRIAVQTYDEIGKLATSVNQMTAQLESFEQRRREFLANVAHELRTPLSYIRGYSQAVVERVVPPNDRDRYLQIVQEESIRLGRLVDDLMDLAQMDEGQLSLDLQPLDVRIPIEQAIATLLPQAAQKQVTIHAERLDGLPAVAADGGRVQQVVLNLLDNGLRHTPDGGSLTVSAVRRHQHISVAVKDTGTGIAPADLPLIFDRFHKRSSSGRGLGLAIVRSLVKAHGGEVGVTSEPGKGATFWFTLPIADPGGEADAPP